MTCIVADTRKIPGFYEGSMFFITIGALKSSEKQQKRYRTISDLDSYILYYTTYLPCKLLCVTKYKFSTRLFENKLKLKLKNKTIITLWFTITRLFRDRSFSEYTLIRFIHRLYKHFIRNIYTQV